jgi:hypothetical protein
VSADSGVDQAALHRARDKAGTSSVRLIPLMRSDDPPF